MDERKKLMQEILDLIPRYKNGTRAGQPRNEHYLHYESILHKYTYDTGELGLIKKEIEGQIKRDQERRDEK